MTLASFTYKSFVFIQFITLRGCHYWEASARCCRKLITPGHEQWCIQFGFIWRYISVAFSTWLTILTIQAVEDEDDARFKELIMWGMLPSAARTLSAMWTSTLCRQEAKDVQVFSNSFLYVAADRVAHIRHAQRLMSGEAMVNYSVEDTVTMMIGKDKKIKTGCLSTIRSEIVGRHRYPSKRLKKLVPISHPYSTLYTILAKGIEMPINYIIQKILVVILLVLYFFPGVPYYAEIAVYSRWLRVITTVFLAPFNHFLAWFRVKAYKQIEDGYAQAYDVMKNDMNTTTTILIEQFEKHFTSPEHVTDGECTVCARLSSAASYIMAADSVTMHHAAAVASAADSFNIKNKKAIVTFADDRESDVLLNELWALHKLAKAMSRACDRLDKPHTSLTERADNSVSVDGGDIEMQDKRTESKSLSYTRLQAVFKCEPVFQPLQHSSSLIRDVDE